MSYSKKYYQNNRKKLIEMNKQARANRDKREFNEFLDAAYQHEFPLMVLNVAYLTRLMIQLGIEVANGATPKQKQIIQSISQDIKRQTVLLTTVYHNKGGPISFQKIFQQLVKMNPNLVDKIFAIPIDKEIKKHFPNL